MQNFNGLKEALEYVVNQSHPRLDTITIGGKVYATEPLEHVADEPEKEYHYAPLQITTLTGFIDYVKANRDGLTLKDTLIQVTGAAGVSLISTPSEKKLYREVFIKANAELPGHAFGTFSDVERFIVYLQSCFVDSPDRETLLKYIGNIEESETVNAVDDGVSQRIVARTGIASVETVVLPNPVKLRPYRTFQELEQPESEFVLRVRKGGHVALFEADGGAWKVKCRALIKAALADALKDVEGVCIIG